MNSRLAMLLLTSVLVGSTGCCSPVAQPDTLRQSMGVVDGAVARLHSDDFGQRKSGVQELAALDAEVISVLVVPRLALETALRSVAIDLQGGSQVGGRIVGGDAKELHILVTRRVALGARLTVQWSEVKAMRLFD